MEVRFWYHVPFFFSMFHLDWWLFLRLLFLIQPFSKFNMFRQFSFDFSCPFSLYCFVEVRWFCWSNWSTQCCLLLIFKQFVMLSLSPLFLLCLALCLSRFLNLSRIWRCLWGGGYLESPFQLFLHGSLWHEVYLDFVVRWSSCQDQQSNVWIGHFFQNQLQSPGIYGWSLPMQEREDSMSGYSMIAFGCNF